ncbi:hypothetical protein [Phytomonospora endophytica]|uniref:Uncharacterized protein n=1 Tax=Phytomonospora endophytica TaxID=714109 RepID=A0A841FLQ3_9ACTN|nr:hypothetical protein [Phytomonospora endophytica]MBB6034117.1 hypothetical protein [Phytomonospora endophytica]GIG66511.1 hypothetical protein Pen01_28060 [Phytomonospora endophytica]
MSDSTGGPRATALLERTTGIEMNESTTVSVPDSPAELWVSTSRPVSATCASTWDHVSADTASWVAPPVTFCSA